MTLCTVPHNRTKMQQLIDNTSFTYLCSCCFMLTCARSAIGESLWCYRWVIVVCLCPGTCVNIQYLTLCWWKLVIMFLLMIHKKLMLSCLWAAAFRSSVVKIFVKVWILTISAVLLWFFFVKDTLFTIFIYAVLTMITCFFYIITKWK